MSYKPLSRPVGAFQITERDRASYRLMSHPPQQQPLQLLYPGRTMSYSDFINGIEHSSPEGIDSTMKTNLANTIEARNIELDLKHYLGGDKRLLAHPFVEPEVMIQDPGLGYNQGIR